MKELSIEEKAKRYDEALKEAVIAHKDEDKHLKATLERIFPELKESEDERIKKLLVEAVIQVLQDQYCSNRGVSKEKVVAWLEKQGDANKEYWRGYREGKQEILDKYTELEKKGEQKPAWIEEDETMITDLSVIVHTYFSEISGIPFKYDLSEDKIRNWLISLKERVQPQLKQEWSEEDNRNLSIAINYVFQHGYLSIVDWLRNLKERYTWKPSDEQMENLSRAVNGGTYRTSLLMKLYQDLKKLREE